MELNMSMTFLEGSTSVAQYRKMIDEKVVSNPVKPL